MKIISIQPSILNLVPKALVSTTLLFCMILTSTHTLAAQLYRYKDDQGNYVLNHTIPPKYVKKGYDILNRHGRVIRTVAPELTPEQIAERDAAIEQERIRKLEAEKQAIRDNELRQLYSHPDDAVRALSRRVQDINGLIQVKLKKIETNNDGIMEEESKAAARQRQGLQILDTTHQKIEKYKSDIAINKHDISELENELAKVKADFAEKVERLEIITGKKSNDYAAFLEKLKNGKSESASQTEASKN